MNKIRSYVRPNIRSLQPYSSARDEYEGEASIWLDANENPNNTDLNRYPDPHQSALKAKLSELKQLQENRIFVGNGSDEAIDLLIRSFCEPNVDQILTFTPTYGMYRVCAEINNVELLEIPLTPSFELPALDVILDKISSGIIFICSPNNPTGNSYDLSAIEQIAQVFDGIVVVDEAYIDFSPKASALSILNSNHNLVVLQTMSKAFGLAGARVGMAYAHPEVIEVLNRVKPPYNVNALSIAAAVNKLNNYNQVLLQISELRDEKARLVDAITQLDYVKMVHPSDANFILVVFDDAIKIFKALMDHGIIVRNRTKQIADCLRISIGTQKENQVLIATLKSLT